MTQNLRSPSVRLAKQLQRILFSAYTGMFITVVLFVSGPEGLTAWFYRMNSSIKVSMHLIQTDVATAGFVFFIVATVLSICIWGLMVFSSRSRLEMKILRYGGGFMALLALPIMEVWTNESWLTGWENIQGIAELADVAFICAALIVFLYFDRQFPIWASSLVLGGHYFLWFRHFGLFSVYEFGVGEQVTVLASCLYGVAWVLYFGQSSST